MQKPSDEKPLRNSCPQRKAHGDNAILLLVMMRCCCAESSDSTTVHWFHLDRMIIHPRLLLLSSSSSSPGIAWHRLQQIYLDANSYYKYRSYSRRSVFGLQHLRPRNVQTIVHLNRTNRNRPFRADAENNRNFHLHLVPPSRELVCFTCP